MDEVTIYNGTLHQSGDKRKETICALPTELSFSGAGLEPATP